MRSLLLIGFCLVCGAAASPLTTAIAHRDIAALETLSAETEDAALLARGAVLALRHRDTAALAILEPLTRAAASQDISAGACFALSDIYLRQTRYAEARAALHCVEVQSGAPLEGEPLQVLHDTAALAGEKPMTLVRSAAGSVEARRDHAGLIRVPVTVNGERIRAVIDSDASFSVVSRSVAERLGLRILPDALTVLTTARPDQPMQLAVADRLMFGDAELANVVFAVLPDSAMRLRPDYRIEAVIGLPVLVTLGRIAYDREAGRLDYGRGAAAAAMEPNVLLSGLDPFVLVQSGSARVRLALDTAADTTTLNASVWTVTASPKKTSERVLTWRGAGGSITDRARVLDEWRIVIGNTPVTLQNVAVQSRPETDRHGALGLDAVKDARRWVLDFDAMCFWLEPDAD
ncbi:retropepsin-like aspartic protease [Rhizomicrobium electricum]|uniref:Peptidase A2 domain-containing protein n=1 Tax=Rhizomicrobium electricum TaxID=480070 RepID=A0ABN1F2X0_9PROT|nr:retropepsin-like aspartic protease [Rhizomicrobium electricum]NIJ49254.1 putative aspartyl protease [Rhizomicrobium electricum]